MKIFEIRQATNPMMTKLIAAAIKSPTPNFTEPTLHVAFCHSHDEIIDERLDERGERGRYYDRYRQRHNVLFEQELLEFFQHCHGRIPVGELRLTTTS